LAIAVSIRGTFSIASRCITVVGAGSRTGEEDVAAVTPVSETAA
jgi:hypothetical protein